MILTDEDKSRLIRENVGCDCTVDPYNFIDTIESAVLEKLKVQDRLKPVAWLITVEKQDGSKETYPAMGRFKDVKASCDFGEPIPLYEHPLPPADVVRDAERYRWLREKAAPQWRNGPGLYWYLPRFMDGTPQEKLDAAIDAAMKEMK